MTTTDESPLVPPRTELAKLLGDHFPQSAARDDYLWSMADIIMERGFRKPRSITTVEELDALPEGSVVLDRNGLSLHKMGPLGIWNASNHTWDVQRAELEADAFPAIVLWEPEAEATQ